MLSHTVLDLQANRVTSHCINEWPCHTTQPVHNSYLVTILRRLHLLVHSGKHSVHAKAQGSPDFPRDLTKSACPYKAAIKFLLKLIVFTLQHNNDTQMPRIFLFVLRTARLSQRARTCNNFLEYSQRVIMRVAVEFLQELL